MAQGFDSLGEGTTPVVVSVPHAGRDYPVGVVAQLAVPQAAVRLLEDRYVDLLAEPLTGLGHAVLMARTPRLVVDLNRAEGDIDPGSIAGLVAHASVVSALARGGLGVVPHRLPGGAAIWKTRVTGAELRARLGNVHRPYHAALAGALARARSRFGSAVLIDLHSMPPLPDDVDVVLGDRRGTSAGRHLVEAARESLQASGLRVALNHPYQGGHIVARHGSPARGVHALQVEVDRRLYLDPEQDEPGHRIAEIGEAIARMTQRLSFEIAGLPYRDAAE